jgi:ADP-ribose pyrophosphatase
VTNKLEWREIKTEFRESRGSDVRWLVNRETIYNAQTGVTVTRGCIRHPGICVVAFVDPDTIVMMRQYRYSIDGELWELTAGTLEGREVDSRVVPGESPEKCAARELREETGYQADTLERLPNAMRCPEAATGSCTFSSPSGLRG